MKKLLTILSFILVPMLASATNFYPKTTGNLALLATWGTATNGTGTPPTIFTNTADVFIVNKAGTVSTSWIVKNLTIGTNSPNTTGALTLSTSITVQGILTLTRGTITSNGNLTLDLNTGSISNTGTGSITGDIIVTKNILSKGWHFIGTPLNNVTLAQFNDDALVKATSSYYYDETNTSTDFQNGWTSNTVLTSSIVKGKGYILFFQNPGVLDFTGTYIHNETLNTGVTFTYSNFIGAVLNSDGWNLVSNPYPSTLDWDNMSNNTNVNDAIYYWDAVNKRYASYINGGGNNGGTRYIPSLQAFWVKIPTTCYSFFGGCADKTGNVSFIPSARVNTPNYSLWRNSDVEYNILRIKATSPNTVDDETVIRISEFASDDFDGNWDAYKLYNGGSAVNVYTSIGDVKYSVNSVSDTFDVAKEISLNFFAPITDTYTLTFTNGFPSEYSVSIKDNTTNIVTAIDDVNNTYSFDYTVGDDSTRFTLLVEKSVVTDNTPSTNTPDALNVKISTDNNIIHINNPDNYNISVYNYNGQEYSNSSNTEMNVSVNQGIYLVKTVSSKGTRTDKVYVK